MINTYRRLSSIGVLASFLVVSACATTPQPKQSSPKNVSNTKTAAKNTSKQPISKPGSKETVPANSSTDLAVLEKAFVRSLSPSFEILGSDLARVQAMQPLPPQSLAEALAAVVALRYTNESSTAGRMKVKDLNQGERASGRSPRADMKATSFKDLFRTSGLQLDLMRALRTNPFLQSTRVYQLANLAARKLTDNSVDKRNLEQLLAAKARRFQSLLGQDNKTSQNQIEDVEVNSVEPVDMPNSDSGSMAAKDYSIADIRQGDAILGRATQLANRGQYREAISLASRISSRDPFYAAAQGKIRMFSNLAVQKLRQRAAQAFQSSLPVNDTETKAAYLKEAQGYLQDALQNYPKADQLNTVRENLEVISNDLENINPNSNENG